MCGKMQKLASPEDDDRGVNIAKFSVPIYRVYSHYVECPCSDRLPPDSDGCICNKTAEEKEIFRLTRPSDDLEKLDIYSNYIEQNHANDYWP